MISLSRIIYDVCLEWFGAVSHKKDKKRRKTTEYTAEKEGKVKIWTENAEAPIKRSPNSWEVVTSKYPKWYSKKDFGDLPNWKSEKTSKEKTSARRSFYTNPFTVIRELDTVDMTVDLLCFSWNQRIAKLDVLKEELENHLRMTYSDDLNTSFKRFTKTLRSNGNV